MVETTLAPPQQQEDETEDMNTSSARKYASLPEKATITTEAGTKLMKVSGIGAYMQIPANEQKYKNGKAYTIELEPGERLHRFEGTTKSIHEGRVYTTLLQNIQEKNREGKIVNVQTLASSNPDKITVEATIKYVYYVVQPAGNPGLNRKGAANLLGGLSPIWVYKLVERGPCHPNGGLLGYIMSPNGLDRIPRTPTGVQAAYVLRGGKWVSREIEPHHGSEIFLYENDVNDYVTTYINPSEEEYKNIHVPPGLLALFKRFAQKEIDAVGYVTMTSVWAQAKTETSYMGKEDLRSLGLEQKLTDKNYAYLRSAALKEGWKNPRRSKNERANSYRRNYRELIDIE
jgi:hypothetical protein